MSDDLFESFGSDDLFEDEETENEPEGEGQNKTFIIAVAALGGLLVITLILFGVWAFVINPRMQANLQPVGDVTVVEETPIEQTSMSGEDTGTVEETSVVEEQPTATATATPEPTATPVVGPTKTPTPEPVAASGDEEDGGEGGDTENPTPTQEPRRTPTPSPTRRPIATPKATVRAPAGSSSESLSQTGIGDVMLIVGAIALIGVAFFARRLRRI
jgi:hypothetical protein